MNGYCEPFALVKQANNCETLQQNHPAGFLFEFESNTAVSKDAVRCDSDGRFSVLLFCCAFYCPCDVLCSLGKEGEYGELFRCIVYALTFICSASLADFSPDDE